MIMGSLTIKTSGQNYRVYTESGIRRRVLEYFPKEYSAYYVITDDNVNERYGQDLIRALTDKKTYIFSIQPGEGSKSFAVYHAVMTDMLEKQLDRSCCVIAFGGGVVGDLSGFVAATFLRGVDYVQIPTTLLAHDSSVGGKVAINHELGKNLIGAFYQPSAVLYDTECLTTLSAREWRSGFAELIKHAVISSEAFLSDLMAAVPEGEAMNAKNVSPFLLRGIQVKAEIVEQDEREKGLRMHLNFGHTLGHALEKLTGFGKITHGEGVIIGMLFALFISRQKGADIETDNLTKWLENLGYTLSVPSYLTADQCVETMFYDKKKKSGHIQFILLTGIGKPYYEVLSRQELKSYFTKFVEQSSNVDN